jgi:hypothetical protein
VVFWALRAERLSKPWLACARNVNAFECLIVYLIEQVKINVIDLEGIGVLAKVDAFQPISDRPHAASSSSTVLASLVGIEIRRAQR